MTDGVCSSDALSSPEPTKQLGSPEKSKVRVFISYSRDDLDFADQLDAALELYGFDCLLDRHGISGGEDWKRRLGNLISEADTVVFVLSPASARSTICDWEVAQAAALNKRIIPIVFRPLDDASPPPQLRDRNYIFFHAEPKSPGSGFGTGLKNLVAALNTDLDWLREHTRYLQRAIEWDTRGRPANRLLSGDDIAEAKAWAARQPKNAPELTTLHLDFIRASEGEAEKQLSQQRKQLEEMAAAQNEREKALHKAEEAVKHAADEQNKRLREHRKRARNRNIALIIVSVSAVVSWLFGYVAFNNFKEANAMMESTTKIISELQPQMSINTQQEFIAVFRAGANNGNALAMSFLGWTYATGFGASQDYVKAREWYEKASSWPGKNAYAMNNLGALYQNGLGVAQDYTRAREWYEKAADNGNANAMNNLGWLYQNGFGVTQDYAKAREWYEKAADKGDTDAMNNLAALYVTGRGVANDYEKVRDWLEKAAAAGSPYAMKSLGVLYESGRGMAKDYVKARDWYEQAAEKGDTGAMNNLGVLYSSSGGMKDYGKASDWFMKAAEKGDAGAMRNLGLLYQNGFGMTQDYTKSREWYVKAAEQGDADAMNNLGWLYQNGFGVPQDYTKAREWYEKAADKGNAYAMKNLGWLYQNSFGVPQDYTKAREWYEKATENGDADAKVNLEQLTSKETAGRTRRH